RALDLPTVRLAPRETAAFVRPLLEFAGAPLWAATAATDFGLMARAKETGAEVVLCGLGGDEIFDGYPRAFGDSVRSGDVSALIRAARLRVPWTSTGLGRIDAFVLRPLLAAFVPDVIQRGRRRRLHRRRWQGWAGPAVLDYIAREAEAFAVEDMSDANGRYHAYAASSHIADAVEYCTVLAELAHVRVAFPFLDRSIAELVAALPPELLMHGARARGLFRLAARGHVPDVVRLRKDKAHFTCAQRDIFDALGGIDAIADLFSMKVSASLGLVDAHGFQAAIEAFREAVDEDEGAYVTWSALWPALSVEGFLRAHAARETAC
ncbi:MAG: asparagine synthase C-terminal domain-containing protein, partial [Polyangiaceae bacterium]